jgi:two-component system sensor histidine kinase ChvG
MRKLLNGAGGALVALLRRAREVPVRQGFSSLSGRIILLNVAGLVALVIGILHFSQLRDRLIDARVQSLLVQGDAMARAIGELMTGDADVPTLDPDRVAPVLRNAVSATNTRARVYDQDGALIFDSLYEFHVVASPTAEQPGILQRAVTALRTWLNRGDLPQYTELGPQSGRDYEEVEHGLNGFASSMVRINDRGEVVVSVALPLQRLMEVHGALMLSTQDAAIDSMMAADRLSIFKVFLVTAGVMAVLSFLLAGTLLSPAPCRPGG